MSRIYYRGAKAAVLCFDLTDKSSFDRLRFWIGELRQHEEVIFQTLDSKKVKSYGAVIHSPANFHPLQVTPSFHSPPTHIYKQFLFRKSPHSYAHLLCVSP